MDRIHKTFQRQNKTFVAYLCVGDGGIDYTVDASLALEQGGVDILELGIPFSDPVADGPVIQKAAQRALSRGTTPTTVLEAARRIRARSSLPLVLFSYYNPILAAGESFYQRAAEAGIDALLVVDLPIEEANSHLDKLRKASLHSIFLASPSTPDQRLGTIASNSSAFVYYVCRKGTTGMRQTLPTEFNDDITRIRSHIDQPLVVGFGIACRNTARDVLQTRANGFVVGSAFVNAVANGLPASGLCKMARDIDPR